MDNDWPREKDRVSSSVRVDRALPPIQHADEVELIRAELMKIAQRTIDMILDKRQDYGTLNIAMTGRYGVSVRIQDKAARLITLTKPGAGEPAADPVADSYVDLIGYSLIGLAGQYWGLEEL